MAVDAGLVEEQFWRMTPAQLRRRIAYVARVREHRMNMEIAREESARQRAAWICATIMNFAGKQLPKGREIKPEDLLGKKKTKKDINKAREALIKRHHLTKRFGIC